MPIIAPLTPTPPPCDCSTRKAAIWLGLLAVECAEGNEDAVTILPDAREHYWIVSAAETVLRDLGLTESDGTVS